VIIENHIFTRGYATHENIAFYDHSWNKFLSYTNIQQISSISLEIIFHLMNSTVYMRTLMFNKSSLKYFDKMNM